MDEQKTIQALKTIFDQCGTGILQNRRRFEAYLEDLLPGNACATERLVLRHAADSSALTLLLRAPGFTADAARRAVEQLHQESRMSVEDAEFVVRCTVAARGVEPDVVFPQEMERIELEKRRKEESIRRKQEEQKHRAEEKREADEGQQNQPLLSIWCKRRGHGRGNLKLYEDRFIYNSIEVPYRDVTVVYTYERLKWIYALLVIAAGIFFPYLFSDSPWTDPEIGLPLMAGYLIVAVFLMVFTWSCNREMCILAKNQKFQFVTGVGEKKQIVSIIRSKCSPKVC